MNAENNILKYLLYDKINQTIIQLPVFPKLFIGRKKDKMLYCIIL